MQYIRSCPSCDSELRFPIDKGTLIIKCPHCNNSFKIDPDDPSTFRLGRFDYSLPPSKKNQLKNITEKILDILYLPAYFLKNIFGGSGMGLKKIIPFLLILFIFLNFYRICSKREMNPEIRQMEKATPVQPPTEKEDFPDEEKKPDYEI